MSEEIYVARKNHLDIIKEFKHFLSMESMVDVTLACDGKSLKAHKLILSACSPYFQSLFMEHPSSHPIVILKDVKYADLKAIIDFMYSGEVHVTESQLEDIVKIAKTLEINVLGEVEITNYYIDNESGNLIFPEFADESENQSVDVLLESRSNMSSPKQKQNNEWTLSFETDDETSRPENMITEPSIENLCDNMELHAPDLDVTTMPFQSNDTNFIQESQEQQNVSEDVDTSDTEVAVEDSVLNLEKETLTNDDSSNGSIQSSSQSDKELNENSPDHSLNLASSMPDPYVVLKDVLSLISNSQQSKAQKDSPHKKLQKKKKSKPKSKKLASNSSELQKPKDKDSGASTSRKILSKIENTRANLRWVKCFRCSRCPFKTHYSESLKRHVTARHLKIRKFKCEQCSYAATLKQHLLRHIQYVHEHDIRYFCSLCSYKTAQSGNLKRHFEIVHEGKKPFKCDKCDFHSAQKAHIKKHVIAIHEQRRDFTCDFCTYRCSAKENLKRHVGLKHRSK